jgi:hypothetical protein
MAEQETVVADEIETEAPADEVETEKVEVEAEAPEAQEEAAPEPEEEEIVVQIGDEAPPEPEERAPDWVRELRKSHRELQRQNRELQAKLHSTNPQVEQLGKKPTLEDFDYDAEKFEGALENWFAKKRQHDEMRSRAQQEEIQQQQAWQAKLEAYGNARQELKVKDYEDAEAITQELLSTVQQGIVLQGADNSALVVYALGKNPRKAKEIASITDPVKFAFAIAKLEKDLKLTAKKAPPPPERSIVKGSAPSSGTIDSTLDRLRAEAEKTGNYTKVVAYKSQKRA